MAAPGGPIQTTLAATAATARGLTGTEPEGVANSTTTTWCAPCTATATPWAWRKDELSTSLDRLGSIKRNLGVAIVVAVVVSAVVSTIDLRLGVPIWLHPLISAAIALVLVQVLARGMTSPLREMSAAAGQMAGGDWDQRVTDTSADEVGDLARAFNAIAAELVVVDRIRSDLLANVSHELRTPIAALQARLENLVDGVEAPDIELLRSMLHQTEQLEVGAGRHEHRRRWPG